METFPVRACCRHPPPVVALRLSPREVPGIGAPVHHHRCLSQRYMLHRLQNVLMANEPSGNVARSGVDVKSVTVIRMTVPRHSLNKAYSVSGHRARKTPARRDARQAPKTHRTNTTNARAQPPTAPRNTTGPEIRRHGGRLHTTLF